MGYKLLILLALVVGALYGLHVLAQDYLAIRGPRLLFRLGRDLNSPRPHKERAHVRWKLILRHDHASCARSLFCEVGAPDAKLTTFETGFIDMLRFPSQEEDEDAHAEFRQSYLLGTRLGSRELCQKHFPTCPFTAKQLSQLMQFLVENTV